MTPQPRSRPVPMAFRFGRDAMYDAARLDRSVLEALINVIRFGLSLKPDTNDLDEDRLDGTYFIRRGLTKEQRRQLDRLDREGGDLDEGSGMHPWQFVIVYREFSAAECIWFHTRRPAIVVERIVGEPELGDLLLRNRP